MRDIAVIVGQSGSGKSHFTKAVLPQYQRRIIYDPLLEYDGLYFAHLDNLIDYCCENPAFSVRTDEFEAFDLLCETAYTLGDCCLAIEEIQRIIVPGQKPSLEFLDIVFRGRHRNVSLIAIAQRASSININIRSQFTKFISFRQSEPNDLQYMYEVCGSWEMVERLPYLQIGEYLEIDNDGCRLHTNELALEYTQSKNEQAPITEQQKLLPSNDYLDVEYTVENEGGENEENRLE